MADTSPVAHEGNPKEDSITISGGDVLSTATLGVVLPFVPATPPPEEVPPPEPPIIGGCPGCSPFQGSLEDQAAIAQCYIDSGCSGSPSCEAVCNDTYGAFRMGMNAGTFGQTTPAYYTSSPSLWQTPRGYLTVNASCPGILAQRLTFDFRATAFGATVDYEGITPATFQTLVIDNWNSTGAHGQRSVADPDGTLNQDLSVGGFIDCRFFASSSNQYYFTRVHARYLAEVTTPKVGVALLTDDATNPKITGYGLIINRVDNTLDTVIWTDVSKNNYSILNSYAYTPGFHDEIILEARQSCPCPWVTTSGVAFPAYPKGGYIHTHVFSNTLGTINVYETEKPTYPANVGGSLSSTAFQSLGYGAVVANLVSNNFCDNQMVLDKCYVSFGNTAGVCS